VPTVLLPYVIHVLLKIANCADRSNWRARVHALNVLRSVFMDSLLAGGGSEVADAIVPGLRAAALAIADESQWAVRNSGVMVFAAVMQRAVDNHKNVAANEMDQPAAASREGLRAAGADKFPPTSKGKIPVEDLFSKNPDLPPFLVAQLDIAMDSSGQRETRLHPMLFPLLVLLSRLERCDKEAPSDVGRNSATSGAHGDDGNNPEALRQIVTSVHSCAIHFDGQIRSIAALALAGLTPRRQRTSVALTILEHLQDELRSSRRWNVMHGRLLQALRLLESAAQSERALATTQQCFALLRAIGAAGSSLPAPIRVVVLQCLQASCDPSARSQQGQVMEVALEALADSSFSPRAKSSQPGLAELASGAARIVVATALQSSHATKAFRLLMGIGSGNPACAASFSSTTCFLDARRAALVELHERLLWSETSCTTEAFAAKVLYDLVSAFWDRSRRQGEPCLGILESDPPTLHRSLVCVCKLLQLHGSELFSRAGFRPDDLEELLQWALSHASAKTSRALPRTSPDLQAYALVVAGNLVCRQAPIGLGESPVMAWVAALDHAAQEEASLVSRTCAVEAIQASGLLRSYAAREELSTADSEAFGRVCLVLADLVQDDEATVRAMAVRAANEIDPRVPTRHGSAAALLVLASCFARISKEEVASRLLLERLLRHQELTSEPAGGADLNLPQGFDHAEDEDGVFEREGLNLFAEPLLFAQVFTPVLAELLAHVSEGDGQVAESSDGVVEKLTLQTLELGLRTTRTILAGSQRGDAAEGARGAVSTISEAPPKVLYSLLCAAAASSFRLAAQQPVCIEFRDNCAKILSLPGLHSDLRAVVEVVGQRRFSGGATFLVPKRHLLSASADSG